MKNNVTFARYLFLCNAGQFHEDSHFSFLLCSFVCFTLRDGCDPVAEQWVAAACEIPGHQHDKVKRSREDGWVPKGEEITHKKESLP